MVYETAGRFFVRHPIVPEYACRCTQEHAIILISDEAESTPHPHFFLLEELLSYCHPILSKVTFIWLF